MADFIQEYLSLLQTLDVALIAVAVSVFVIAISLLRKALATARMEQEKISADEAAELDANIKAIYSQMGKIKPTDTSGLVELKKTLSDIESSKSNAAKKKSQREQYYSGLNARNSVFTPALFLLLALLLTAVGRSFGDTSLAVLFAISASCYSAAGVAKVAFALQVIQTVSLIPDANGEGIRNAGEEEARLSRALRSALELYNQVETTMTFPSMKLEFPPNSDQTIKFRVDLKTGRLIKDASVWLLLPESFKPLEGFSSVWSQDNDYTIPNAVTVEIRLGDLNSGAYKAKAVKIKTPAAAGKYKFFYLVRGEGYYGGRQSGEIQIL